MSSTAKWELRRTLRRKPSFRPTEMDDVKYFWAAYKKGAFSGFIEDGMEAEDFERYVQADLVTRFHGLWTIFGKTARGEIPIGAAFGFWPHPTEIIPFMVLDSLHWFPWASHRNQIEGAVKFFSDVRKEIPMIGFVKHQDKDFFTMIARHGIVRRIGTSHSIFGNKSVAVFETRTPNG